MLASAVLAVLASPALLLANAACAFALNLSAFLLIGKTSALTMNVAGVVKDWILIWLSAAVYHSPVSALSAQGYIALRLRAFAYPTGPS